MSIPWWNSRNLLKVMKALDAVWDSPPDLDGAVRMQIGEDTFYVNASYLRRVNRQGASATCYHSGGTLDPGDLVASALLILKHNPKMFDKWSEYHDRFFPI